MADVVMPKMSDAMEEGKVLRWLKQPGDPIDKGEPVAEIETDKANVELESPESGVVGELRAQEGDTIPIGTVIATVVPAEEMAGVKGGATVEAPPPETKAEIPPPAEERAEPPSQPVPEEMPTPPPTPQQRAPAPPSEPEEEAQPDGIKASPLARKIARDAGVDLSAIQGTGPGGRVVEADVRDFIERGGRPTRPEREEVRPQPSPPAPPPQAPSPVPPQLTAKELTIGHIWETVGKRMTESKQQAPHFYVTMEADMEEAIRMREWLNSTRPEDRQISINDIVVKACAIALVKHPILNASYAGGNKIRMHDEINIAIAVAIPDGLVAPVVRNCERKSLSEISAEAHDLVRRTRNGEIRPEEYSGATFTVSNLGMYGVEEFSAIIVPPQASIIAVGAALPKPVAVDDALEIRHTMRMTVSGDHRVTDGARVSEFMRDIKQALEQPMMLVE